MAGPRGRTVKDQEILLSIGQAAATCGVTYQTFSNWRQSDFPPPVRDDNKVSTIEIGKYIQERIHRQYRVKAGQSADGRLDPQQERARKDQLQADRFEMENKVRMGELISLDKVVAAAHDMILRSRARMLRIPAAVTPKIVGVEDAVVIQNELDDAVRDALDELSVEWHKVEEDDA